MAELRWEVPRADYFRACALIARAAELSQAGAHDALEGVVTELLRIPGYPFGRTEEDTVVVVPKDMRVWITPSHQKEPA